VNVSAKRKDGDDDWPWLGKERPEEQQAGANLKSPTLVALSSFRIPLHWEAATGRGKGTPGRPQPEPLDLAEGTYAIITAGTVWCDT
jgi:hypothetical protein